VPWVRIDEEFPHHPKVAPVGPLGIAMQVAALCYCNRYLTDGLVPTAMAPMLLTLEGIGRRTDNGTIRPVTWQEIVATLVGTGLWEPVEGGWRIHDFHDYQPTREQVEADRVVIHKAKVAGGKARAAGAKRDKGRFTKAQVNTSTTSSPTSSKPAETPADDQQPTSPVPGKALNPWGSPPSLPFQADASQGCKDNPKNRTEGKGKAQPSSRPPRVPRHPSDDFVIRRAREIRDGQGPEAAHAYLRKVGENYGQASREDQLRRLEAIIAQDAAAEAGQP
jgi:hypothetical protein